MSIRNLLRFNYVDMLDALIGMRTLPDKSIDMILADMPFGTTDNFWDVIIPFLPMWKEFERVIKDNGAIVLFAQAPFDKTLAVSNLKLFRYEWIWEKEQGTGFYNAKLMPLKVHENILVFYKKLPTYNPIMTKGHKKVVKKESADKCIQSSNYGKSIRRSGYNSETRYPRSVLKFTSDKNRGKKKKGKNHPTQKPVKLCEYLIKTYTNENEIVLDCCIGSGTTAIAALNTNRRFIGFEKYKENYNRCIERIKKHEKALSVDVGLFAKEIQTQGVFAL